MKTRHIDRIRFENLFSQELERASFELRDDVAEFFDDLKNRTSIVRNSEIVDIFLQNRILAVEEKRGICQDTGYVQVYIEMGRNTAVDFDVEQSINNIVKKVYEKLKLRKSMAHPITRENTQTNTPAFVDVEFSKDNTTRVRILLKGGGSENITRAGFLLPTADRLEILNWVVESVRLAGAKGCPPYLVGVGIGGNLTKAVSVSKKLLLRTIGNREEMDKIESEMADDLLNQINTLPIGFQGLRFGVTAMDVQVKTISCHIATLPIAVSLGCNAVRQGYFEI